MRPAISGVKMLADHRFHATALRDRPPKSVLPQPPRSVRTFIPHEAVEAAALPRRRDVAASVWIKFEGRRGAGLHHQPPSRVRQCLVAVPELLLAVDDPEPQPPVPGRGRSPTVCAIRTPADDAVRGDLLVDVEVLLAAIAGAPVWKCITGQRSRRTGLLGRRPRRLVLRRAVLLRRAAPMKAAAKTAAAKASASSPSSTGRNVTARLSSRPSLRKLRPPARRHPPRRGDLVYLFVRSNDLFRKPYIIETLRKSRLRLGLDRAALASRPCLEQEGPLRAAQAASPSGCRSRRRRPTPLRMSR